MKKYSFTRREFMQWGASAAAAGVAAQVTLLEPKRLWALGRDQATPTTT